MATLTAEDIIKASGGRLVSGDSMSFRGVSIDSRTISEGEIFFAIRGDKFDGHDFLGKALIKGSGAVVDSVPDPLPEDRVIICVSDTLRSLQDLAHFLRMKKDIPVVAVTGSNGKTTTKEMIHSILCMRYRTLKNEGNLNNHVGLPLTLVRLDPDDEAAVLEMGMNARGEIRRLCEIAVPSHGVVTNIGSAHLGMLGSREAIRSAKLEILQDLNVLIANGDDDYLIQGVRECKAFKGQMITFGINSECNVKALDAKVTETGSSFIIKSGVSELTQIDLNVHGLFNIYNALAASAVCLSLGMTVDEIKKGLEGYRGFPMRFETVRTDDITVINDSYNANPTSMKEALKEAIRVKTGGRIVAVLGDMSELGEFSEEEHRNLGKFAADAGVDVFIGVGKMMALAANEIRKQRKDPHAPEVVTFISADEAKNKIMDIVRENDTVFIKGSRMMAMEKIFRSMTDAV